MSTMDILEDLLTLDGFLHEAGAPSLLDAKLLIGSLNRGGLAGTQWEMDDPITGPTAATCATWSRSACGVPSAAFTADSPRLR